MVSVVDFVCMHSALCGAFFGARCAFLGSFLVCGPPFLGSILVHSVWSADLGADFGARCAFLVRCLLGIDFGAWCADVGVDHSQRATRSIKIGKDLGGNRARDLSNMGPWSWRMLPFRVDFGARCAFSGSVLVCGAPFLRWILVRGAPFLGWILVRGMWCADFGPISVRRFWARFWCAVRRFWAGFWCAVCGAPILGRFRCTVRRFWARFLVCGAPFLISILVHGVWCADFGADFGARCAFLGSILARCLFWDRFWCVVR